MAEAKIAKLSKELYENQSSLNPDLFGDSEDEDLFKPALADEVKVGFFNLDRACQTQQTDIIQLKEMTNVLQVLIKDSSHIKRDLTLTRKKLETEYENKLQEKSLDLYTRINHKLEELEAMHIERVGIVRRAYRQQLADALARVETLFQARFEKQMEKDKERHQLELRKLQQQVSSLTQTIQRNESVIIMLKQQLATKQKIEESRMKALRKALSRVPAPSFDRTTQCDLGLSAIEEARLKDTLAKLKQYYAKNEFKASTAVQYDLSTTDFRRRSRSRHRKFSLPPPREDTTKIDALTKQMDSLKEQLKSKDKEIGTMEDELDNKNAEITSTTERCNKLQNELEKENILRSQLAMELAEMKSQAEKSSSEARRLLEKQRQEMEIAAEEKARKAREEALGATGQKMREMQAEFAQRIGELMKEKERLEQQLVQERERPQATPPKAVVQAPETDFDELVKSERELRVHVEKLRKEIERINRAWEKKFTILQASLYALKDESYLRQHLEKQHTALRQATISYTAGPSKTGNRRPVLPSIPNRAASPDPLASYTVSRASNRHLLENQIISDEEEDMIYGQNIGLNNQSRFSSQSIA